MSDRQMIVHPTEKDALKAQGSARRRGDTEWEHSWLFNPHFCEQFKHIIVKVPNKMLTNWDASDYLTHLRVRTLRLDIEDE